MPLIDIGIEVIFQTILLVFLPLAYFAFEGVDVPHLSSGYWYSIFVVNTTNQKKELILAAMFVGRMEPNEEAL
jgi:hypothetical protein